MPRSAPNPIPLGLLTLLILASGCSETFESHYPALGDAQGAIERGWIPGFLPSLSTGIREAHDIDTNRGMMAIVFDAADADSFLQHLVAVPEDRLDRIGPWLTLKKTWWPEYLKAGHLGVAVKRHGLDIYESGAGIPREINNRSLKWFVALDRRNNAAYLWH